MTDSGDDGRIDAFCFRPFHTHLEQANAGRNSVNYFVLHLYAVGLGKGP